MLPQNFDGIQDVWTFDTVAMPEQIVLDTRNELSNRTALLSKTTFNPEFNLYKEKPRMVVCEETLTMGWKPSLVHMPERKAVLSLGGHPSDDDMICVTLYQDYEPFERIQRTDAPKKHYKQALVATDLRPVNERDHTSILCAPCVANDHSKPCALWYIT